MYRSWRFRVCLLVLSYALVMVGVTTAQAPEVTDNEVNEVARGLYCPVCESTPLDVCPTQACADWREVIRTKLAEGQNKEEIHEYFALQYGNQVLAEPPKEGFALVVWILPVLAVLAGGIFFVWYVKGLQKRTAAGPAPAAAGPTGTAPTTERTGDPYLSRIEQELQDRK